MESALKRPKTTGIDLSFITMLLPALAPYKDLLGVIVSYLCSHTLFVLRCAFNPLDGPLLKNDMILESTAHCALRHGHARLFYWTRYNGCLRKKSYYGHAARYTHGPEMLKMLDRLFVDDPVVKAVFRIGKVQNVTNLNWLLHHSRLDISNINMFRAALEANNLTLLKWLHAHRLVKERQIANAVGTYFSYQVSLQWDIVKWIFDNFDTNILPRSLLYKIVKNKRLDLIDQLVKKSPEIKQDHNICISAAETGDLKLLKQLRARGFEWSASVCGVAARGRHLDVLAWARQNGCPE